MGTFNERLHDAMLASGIETAAELARRCGVSRQAVINWLASKDPDLTVAHLLMLCAVLRVRKTWLSTGHGHPTPWSPQAVELLKILEALTPAKVALWLRWGHRLADCRRENLTQ